MEAYIRLMGGLCIGRKTSASSCQRSALSYQLPTKSRLKPKAYYLIPEKKPSAVSSQLSDMARHVRAISRLKPKIHQQSAIGSQALDNSRWLPAKSKLIPKAYHLIPFLILVFVSCGAVLAQEPVGHTAPAAQAESISGVVVSAETGQPLEGATVKIKNTNIVTFTNAKGEFTLITNNRAGEIEVSFLGYQTKEITFASVTQSIIIVLEEDHGILEEVTVNTGYQEISKERATGSFVHIDNELLSRSVGRNILDRLEGITSGVLFNKNADINIGANNSAISIRGRSTIFAETSPLIVLDNFPYDGDLENINPNDIESIDILRDASAASIWGAKSGNGVIVLTSKAGSRDQPIKIAFKSDLTLQERPDLFSLPLMTSSDYIDLELFLFDKNHFSNRLKNEYLSISPIVEMLNMRRGNLVSQGDSAAMIDRLRNSDIRNHQRQYYYRQGINKQYSLNINGGSTNNSFLLSLGYDDSKSTSIHDEYKRFTLNINDQYALLNDKLIIGANVILSSSVSNEQSNYDIGMGVYYPYTMLADESGNPLSVFPNYRKSWLDTVGHGMLPNWDYTPINEIHANNNKAKLTDYRLNSSVKYRFTNGLDLNVLYQYSKGVSETKDLHSEGSYYVRDLVNQYAQIDYLGKTVTYPIPSGDIVHGAMKQYTTQNFRGQINYNKLIGTQYLSMLVGFELRDHHNFLGRDVMYGYNYDNESFSVVDLLGNFRKMPEGFQLSIPNLNSRVRVVDHSLSYFINGAYNYKNLYTLSASARKDESNLFGVDANQKGIPLWSIGALWNLSQEKFFHDGLFSNIRIKMTYGSNGNVDKTLSAYPTASLGSRNVYGANYAVITNPPNPELKWEKINMLNTGLDFSAFKNIITGSVEYYVKKGKDIIGVSPLSPQTGISSFKGNTADISGEGIDISLNARLLNRGISWSANLLYSYVTDKIDIYKLNNPSLNLYVNGNYMNPMEGYPYSALFSYRWAGLDPQTGSPRGYIDGLVSSDYTRLINPLEVDEIVYSGTETPTSFGGFRNTIKWEGLSLTFNVTYRFGHVFRKPSIMYYSLFSSMLGNGGRGHSDYEQRWRVTGDENTTVVPSLVYPLSSPNRDGFYEKNEILIEKGDNIRLQDVKLSYAFSNQVFEKIGLKTLKTYCYINNLGLLWKATKSKVDPDYIRGMRPSRNFSIGLSASF